MRARAFCRFRSTDGSVRHTDTRTTTVTLQMGEEDGELAVFVDRFHEEPNALRNATDRYDFRVDGVLCDASQKSVYDAAASRLVQACAQGHNATLLCHGQRGAGKSFTCFGEADYEARGCAPRCLQELYQHMEEVRGKIEYEVRIRGLEIFGNQIRDLLEPPEERTIFSVSGNTSSLHGCAANAAKGRVGIGGRARRDADGGVVVRRNQHAGVVVENATERVCASELEALETLFECVAGRTEGPFPALRDDFTKGGGVWAPLRHARKALYRSEYGGGFLPRSHVIVTVTVVQRFPYSGRAGEVVESKLQFVDFASSHGSINENCSEDAVTARMGLEGEEKMNAPVRQSLGALQSVVAALNRPKSKVHYTGRGSASYVPFMHNATTALLQDAIGGGSVCSLVSHIRPEQYELLNEMLATLRFAQQMSHVTSRPVTVQPANSGMRRALEVASLKRQVGQLQKELRLRSTTTPAADTSSQRSDWGRPVGKQSAGEFFRALSSAVGGFPDGSAAFHRNPSADPTNTRRPASEASALSNMSVMRATPASSTPPPPPPPLPPSPPPSLSPPLTPAPAPANNNTSQQRSRPSTASIMRRTPSPTLERKATPPRREADAQQDTSSSSLTTSQPKTTRLLSQRQSSNATRFASQEREAVDPNVERGTRINLCGAGVAATSTLPSEATASAAKRPGERSATLPRSGSMRNRVRPSKIVSELTPQPVVVTGELDTMRGVSVGIGTPHTFAEELFKQTPMQRKPSVRRPVERKISTLLNVERVAGATSAFSRQDSHQTPPRSAPRSFTPPEELRPPAPGVLQTALATGEKEASGSTQSLCTLVPTNPKQAPQTAATEEAVTRGAASATGDADAAETASLQALAVNAVNHHVSLSKGPEFSSGATLLSVAASGPTARSSKMRIPRGTAHSTGTGTCRNAAFDEYLRTSEGTIQLRELFAAQSAFLSLKQRLIVQQQTVATLLAQQKNLDETMSQMPPPPDTLDVTGTRDASASLDERRPTVKRGLHKSSTVPASSRRSGAAATAAAAAAGRSRQASHVRPSGAASVVSAAAGEDVNEADPDEDLTDWERNERDRSLARIAVEKETAVLLSLHSERTEAVRLLQSKQMQLLHGFEGWFFTCTGRHASPGATTVSINRVLPSALSLGPGSATSTAESRCSHPRPPSAPSANGRGAQSQRPWSPSASGSRTSTRSCVADTSPSLSSYIRRRLPVQCSTNAMNMEESTRDSFSGSVGGALRESSTLCSEAARFDWLLQQRWRMRDPESVVYYAAQQLAQRQMGKSSTTV